MEIYITPTKDKSITQNIVKYYVQLGLYIICFICQTQILLGRRQNYCGRRYPEVITPGDKIYIGTHSPRREANFRRLLAERDVERKVI